MTTEILQLLDIPRAYTALAEWAACILYITIYRPRRPMSQTIPIALSALVVQVAFFVLTDDMNLYLWLPCMGVAFGLMFLLIALLCNLDRVTCLYTTIRAFALAEFTASLEWQIHAFLWPSDNHIWYQRFGLMLLIYILVFFITGLLEQRSMPRELRLSVTKHELMTAAVIGASFFAMSNLSFYASATPFSSQHPFEVMNIRTLTDAIGVVLLLAFHIQHSQISARKEVDALQSILENQYAQYRMSRDSIEMVNRKYHDLKHQIAALRAEPDAALRSHWLDEMEEDIRSYEAQNKTGNSVLDVVLTGKSLYCQKHGIALTIVADGKPLSFMEVMDICTLFGNALDNAIEAELRLPDKEQRIIHLTLSAQKQFLLFQLENYCPQMPQFRDGLPITTKEDPTSHGFGLKSIRLTAQKYGGTATIRGEDNWFVLKVLIPLPSSHLPGR